MKRLLSILLSLVLAVACVSCGKLKPLPDTVKIDGKEYQRAFSDTMFPCDDSMRSDAKKISGRSYYMYSATPYDCRIVYDNNGKPNVYFCEDQFKDATAFYSYPGNFDFYCIFGNLFDIKEQQKYLIDEIDTSMFEQLIAFAEANSYDPLSIFHDTKGLKTIVLQDSEHWMEDKCHIFKESRDGAFCTSKGFSFFAIENQLCLLYYYDFANEEAPKMLYRIVPKEISDYFISILQTLKSE